MDHAEAMRWSRLAAEQGVAEAQFNLGQGYSEGQGVAQDGVEAVRWFQKAAEQGYRLAQFNLGFEYYEGECVPKDDAEAYVWFNLAAANGVGDGDKARDLAAKELSPEARMAAQTRARELHAQLDK